MKSFLLYDLSSYALSTLATPGEFENGGFSLKAHQMFSVHTTPEKFHGVVFDENSVRGITWFSCLHRFRKLKSSFKRLSVCTKTKSQRFQIPRVWRALSKSTVFQWRLSEDGRSNRSKKAAVLVDMTMLVRVDLTANVILKQEFSSHYSNFSHDNTLCMF